jgi:hypothetical protein
MRDPSGRIGRRRIDGAGGKSGRQANAQEGGQQHRAAATDYFFDHETSDKPALAQLGSTRVGVRG